MISTPGDVLSRCNAMDARIAAATRAVDSAPPDKIDKPFRDAWNARARRWHEIRSQCSDWLGRWGWNWEAKLDDWFRTQVEWERQIEKRSGRAVPIPHQPQADEQPSFPQFPRDTGKGFGIGVGVVVAMVGVGVLAYSFSRR